ncbi:MAG: dynamin-related protein 1A [Hyperionvirus sp.]|uniref:Dynamin-related protein 1A n=1 Tax=Hyperionvirus sp. TaxID=2487770 RepID=A0A3G5A6Q9_9VIRU|nr:MAG: dynamin-related protein 1A [Hyperionvirus sp.]
MSSNLFGSLAYQKIFGKDKKEEKKSTSKISDENVLDIIDQLIKLVTERGIKIDSITLTTVGDQNSGKTTVMNRLIGPALLPMRNPKTSRPAMTICPTIINTRKSDDVITVSVTASEYKNKGLYGNPKEARDGVQIMIEDCQNKMGLIITEKTITVDAIGPAFNNMHFIDLPGIINDDGPLSLNIKSLARKYISHSKNTIVLFVMRAQDPQVASAWEIIRDIPKDNIILVITRPDGLDSKDKTIAEVITGERKLRIPQENIYIVKNPDTIAGKILCDKADAQELEYFENHDLYKDLLNNDKYRDQFGITNLRKKIVQIKGNIKFPIAVNKIRFRNETYGIWYDA